MKIFDLISDKKNNKYFSEEFPVLMDTFNAYLLKNDGYETLNLENLDSWRNEGDFLSLLNDLDIRYSFWPTACRMNDILNNGDLTDGTLSIIVPKENVIANIYSTFRTVKSK